MRTAEQNTVRQLTVYSWQLRCSFDADLDCLRVVMLRRRITAALRLKAKNKDVCKIRKRVTLAERNEVERS